MTRAATALLPLLLLCACGSSPPDTCKDCEVAPDARAVLDPDEQVLGMRASGSSERACSPFTAFALAAEGGGTRGTFEVASWLHLDGIRVLAREGSRWVVRSTLPASARTFTVDGQPRVALQAVLGGRRGAPVEPAASTHGLAAPPPRDFLDHPPANGAPGLEVTLDASRMAEGIFHAATRWKAKAAADAEDLRLVSDLAPTAVTWNGAAVSFSYETPPLVRVLRSVQAGEDFDVTVEVEHAGAPRDVRAGGTLYAHLGPDWAFAAWGLRWYAEPEDGSAAATSISILAPPGMEVAAPGLRDGPTGEGGAERWDFATSYPARQLPFAIGPFAAARTADGRFTSMHLATCTKGQDPAYAEGARDMVNVEAGIFGDTLGEAITHVGLDADPADDPCSEPESDGDVAAVSRPGMVFGPAYLWDGPPTQNTDFFFAHETSHQWWGIAVHPAPLDVWLLEGIADHSAGLYLRAARGKETERDVLRDQIVYLDEAIARGDDVPVVPDDPGRLVPEVYYIKGSWVLRTLEGWMGEESWATLLHGWAQDNLEKSVTTAQFEERVRGVLGGAVDPFFETWLRGSGLPRVECADFYADDGSAGEILVHQEPTAVVGGAGRPFVLPLHAAATNGGRSLSGFAVVDGLDGTIPLR